ncbi:hypothetical protein [Paraburkholderia humisilvae]|uniref:Uncharacterized protein n=2 Tax=Paraburkholderia humisilvae TaxID=627669 RepID=A0A6J5EDT9_9BURK|nr:hypothetical protein LMG29542_04532 [Paraburkholderia humisilvae]
MRMTGINGSPNIGDFSDDAGATVDSDHKNKIAELQDAMQKFMTDLSPRLVLRSLSAPPPVHHTVSGDNHQPAQFSTTRLKYTPAEADDSD